MLRSSIFVCVKACALTLLLPLSAIAADYPEKMIFQNIMAEQDIGLGEVEAFAQDKDGFMWFGGRNGLLRYDAYEFKKIMIEADDKDEGSPRDVSQTSDLYIDSKDRLWVGTRWGLYLYNAEREELTRLYPKSGAEVNFNQGNYNRILELANGDMLAATYHGLVRFNPDTMHVTQIAATGNSDGPISDAVYDMFTAKDGTIWLGASAGVSQLNQETMQFDNIVPFAEDPSATKENAIQAIKADKNGHIWAAASLGLYRINPETKEVFRYLNDPNDPRSISDDIHEDLYLDSTGILWVGTDRGGLNYYHYETDSFRHFKHRESEKGSLSSNITRRIFEDNNHDLWVGTYPSGINFHDRSSSAISVYRHDSSNPKSLGTDLVTDIKEDSKGNFWLATDGAGPTYFDRARGEFKNFLSQNGEPARVASKKMLCGLIDSDGDVWFGTWDAGVFLYNKDEERFEQLPLDTSLRYKGDRLNVLTDTSIWDIYEDSNRNLWIASHNSGLINYNKKTKEFRYYNHNASQENSLSDNLLWTIFEDSQKRFWIGAVGGLNLMDRENGTFQRFKSDAAVESSLKNDFINAIAEDKNGNIWVGTNNGLHRFNEDNKTFTLFDDQTSGFSDNGIRTIEVDSANNLWLGTNNGIILFNPENDEIKNYRRFNGEKIGGISTGGSLLTSANEIVMGGPNGLRIYNTAKLKENTIKPPIALNDFRIFTKSIAINGEDGLLQKAINKTDSITLDHKQSMISFNYSALNFRDSDKNQYAYKLEGFDDDWREVGSQRQALYTNLSAGKYTFKVKGSNNDGVWNETGKSIKVIQLPPPWLTWWAKTLYALLILGSLARFIQLQRNKRKAVEEQNRLLELRVAERTTELRAKNDDIQCMLSNMRQGLFTIETDGSIHPEYSTHLESIFEQEKLAGENAYQLLFNGALAGSNELNQVKEGISAIIGEDEMNFEFNNHVLLRDYDTVIAGKTKSLSLDWNAIVNPEGNVQKLMVSVRDVTLLKQMESEAASKKRELDIISQLLNLPSSKYRKFVSATSDFLKHNETLIRENNAQEDSVVSELFRNMHTIKGNCRTYGFTHFSDIVHEVESLYSALSKGDAQWNQEALLKDIARVHEILTEYEHIYSSVLGRQPEDNERSGNGFWMNEESIQRMNKNIDQVMLENASTSQQKSLIDMKSVLAQGISSSLEDALKDVVDSLPSIAEQLEKASPNVNINSNGTRIKNEHLETINNVFAHLLRNCLDHGIEPPAERAEKGKPETGEINIISTQDGQKTQLTINDDGKGLNIKRLYAMGIKQQRWQAGEAVDPNTICNMIFESGVSTKETVSDISGRGVGMDAVRAFIRELGGDVYIQLTAPPQAGLETGDIDFATVKFIIELPETICLTVAD